MQSSDEVSCSDCKLEIIQSAWTNLLFKWLHKCVHPDKEISILTPNCLTDIMNKYKHDICENDIDRAILCTDDIEPFIKYKYPILRLRYLVEICDFRKKQYIMTTVLLFHCCIKSQSGVVHSDICKKMSKYEQEVILKFCELLNEMEITINNVDCAIKEAFDYVKYVRNIPRTVGPSVLNVGQASTDDLEIPSVAELPDDNSNVPLKVLKLQRPSKFNSSVTVLPSVVTDTSDSDLTESETSRQTTNINKKYVFSDSEEMIVFPVKQKRRKIRENNEEFDVVHAESKHQMRLNLEIPRNEEFSNCGGTCCQRPPTCPDPVNKRRDWISIKLPQYKQNKKKEAIPERYEEEDEEEEEEYVKVKEDSEELIAEPKRFTRLDDEDEQFAESKHAIAAEKKFFHLSRNKDFEQKEEEEGEEDNAFKRSDRQRDELENANQDMQQGGQKTTKNKDMQQGPQTKPTRNKSEDLNLIPNRGPGVEVDKDQPHQTLEQPTKLISDHHCLDKCSCSKCVVTGTWCGDSNNLQKKICQEDTKKPSKFKEACKKRKKIIFIAIVVLLFIIILAIAIPLIIKAVNEAQSNKPKEVETLREERLVKFANFRLFYEKHTWICKNRMCKKVYREVTENMFSSLSRCSLICMGPQLWPQPIGYTFFSDKLVALATNKLEYKFQSIPSEAVHQYLAEAFKLFIGDLARLELIADPNQRNASEDLTVKKMTIQIDVETDPEPRLKIYTDESYSLKIDTINNKIVIKISSASFCGTRHGLQTLSQLILLDQSSGKLITLSNAIVKDGPTYKYRGLMIDTARNFIPIVNLMRTIDAMATVKLNTFHWRISDVTSFLLYLPEVPELFEYGAYDRSTIYTKEDVKYLVNRASVRGIRVLIEVAAPGPVGRAWSWHPEVTCPSKTVNFTCSNILCLRLQLHDAILDILETIYSEILDMTKVDDIFHLSDGVFSMKNCYYLLEERQGFLDKALERLKRANKGFLPKLPIIWHTPHLLKDFEAKTWEQYGVQVFDIPHTPADVFLSKFRVIHSSKWDLSCEIKNNRCIKYRTWQEMYGWKSWRNVEVFTVEGGEAILWTDLVNAGNLDNHIWPRAAAVAERLWSDTVVNTSAGAQVYTRLDSQRWRMLLNGVRVQPVWPIWCSLNPSKCLEQVR